MKIKDFATLQEFEENVGTPLSDKIELSENQLLVYSGLLGINPDVVRTYKFKDKPVEIYDENQQG